MMIRGLLVIILVVLLAGIPYSQIPTNPLGLTPAKVRWSQINTDRVKVVFPRALDSVGQTIATLVHELWQADQPTIGSRREKISIFVNPFSILSNGQVTVGPFRSEFKVRTPQFKNTLDWVKDLTIHEYQHVKQFANASQGITGLARHTFGSWAWGGFAATALPRWFWEGDAVAAETGLTTAGRGREPSFLMGYRALLVAQPQLSYEKAAAGSIREFIPDWYHLGYYLTTYTRKTYGEAIWSDVVSNAVRYQGLFFPFAHSLKKHTGNKPKELFNATVTDLKSWLVDKDAEVVTIPALAHRPKRVFTHYTHPIPLPDGSVLCMKGGLNQLPHIIQLFADGTEKKIHSAGIQAEFPYNTLSHQCGWLAWSEYSQHVRWEDTDYSIIKLLNIESGQVRKLGGGDHHYSPVLSPSARQLAAIRIQDNLNQSVSIWSTAANSIQKVFAEHSGYKMSFPAWSEDEKYIYLIGEKSDKHAILRLNTDDGVLHAVTPFFAFPLSHLQVNGKRLIFSAGVDNVNNIYAYDSSENKYYQLTTSTIGAFTPHVNSGGTELFYAEYSADGMQLKKEDTEGSEVVLDAQDSENVYSRWLNQTMGTRTKVNVPTNNYPVQYFRKSSGLIHPHSLLTNISPPTYELSVLADNTFSTFSADAGIRYNANERNVAGFGRLTFAGWFPELTLTFNQLNRASNQFQFLIPNDTTLQTNFFFEQWKESRLSAGVTVPLRFNEGNYLFRFENSAFYNHHWLNVEGHGQDVSNNRDTIIIGSVGRDRFRPLVKPTLSNQNFGALTLNTSFQISQRRAIQHINTRLGLFMNLLYRQSLDNSLGSYSLQGNGLIFLPGICKNHSLWLQGNFEKHSILDTYVFPDVFTYPRGYAAILHDEINGFKINYEMPLFYPDLALGGLLFWKRAKSNVFFDVAQVKLNFPFNSDRNYWSAGIELTLDTRLIRLLEVDWGVRYSYVSDPQATINNRQHQFDFLVLSIRDR